MNDIYEFRRAAGKGAILLTFIAVLLLLMAVVIYAVASLIWLAWVFVGITIVWMLLPRPALGIRVDETNLTVSAWSKPRAIALDDIAHLRAYENKSGTEVTVVYKDKSEESLFSGDFPDIDTLISIMAARGIAVRDEAL
ncbi:hypothetical protein [Loktanella sp. Alg231-35]|uniref:hypothetical protein n=1 Tax=Loktanella sp. Alg231-35 TaxID=1922220 RepID=UPI000D5568E2|nr:hypothetical protein [Loktanella sp. Alg231-35]